MERFEPDDTQQFKRVFNKHLEKIRLIRLAVLHLNVKKHLSVTERVAHGISKAFSEQEYVYKELVRITLEIEKSIDDAVCFLDYFDCNYLNQTSISKEEERKILRKLNKEIYTSNRDRRYKPGPPFSKIAPYPNSLNASI